MEHIQWWCRLEPETACWNNILDGSPGNDHTGTYIAIRGLGKNIIFNGDGDRNVNKTKNEHDGKRLNHHALA